ncbi:MAG: hypothetical protein QXD66_04000 [Candidatus Nezhaarchaeales archaeon]|nr:MAG: hypothetical protein DSO06_04995 [Candidatus Nezhaarchaeota archaeon WYZ-LMO8]TDA35903.1 MAG: hypothetical protein DSO05_04520 [Candidatus Nezhaarchaeota archaeon WYZ-LMO7]
MRGEEREAYMKIPAGVPYSIIAETAQTFNLRVVELEVNIPPLDDVYGRPKTLVLRGKIEDLMRAREFMIKKLEERIRELEDKSTQR